MSGNDPSPPTNASSASYEMPYNNTAVVLSFFDPSVDDYPGIIAMLQARGYQVAGVNTVDLDTLRNLPNQPIGVLYILTHGLDQIAPVTDANPTPTLSFGLATTQSADVPASSVPGQDGVALRADIAAGRVIVADANTFARGSDGKVAKTGTLNVYYTTKAFFDYYWKGKTIFAQNSMVFINGCFSADSGFQSTLTGCGAGLVLGWDWPAMAEDAASTADYIFDRMLGTNNPNPAFFPESLPQRPFTWDQASSNMSNFKSPLQNPLGTSENTFGGTVNSSALSPVMNTGGILVPSITALGPIELTKQMQVNGNFGSQQGVVMFLDSPDLNSDGTAMNVQSWTPTTITVDLPPAGGSASQQVGGYVVVQVDTRTSNCVPLTAYTGQVVATGSGDQAIQVVATADCYFRLDCHLVRGDVTKPLTSASYIPIPHNALLTPDSTLNYQASGSSTDPNGGHPVTSTLSGGGSLPVLSSIPAGCQAVSDSNFFNVVLQFNPTIGADLQEVHDALISLSLSQDASTTTVVLTTTQETGTTTTNVPAFSFCDFEQIPLLQQSPAWDLPDPQYQLTNLGGILPDGLLSVQLQVQCAPDPSKGEDYIQVLSQSA